MPESGLSLSIDDLKAEIGNYLGYSRGLVFGEVAWDTRQTNNIVACLKTGLSNVYTPPRLSNTEPPHNWSFLRPFGSFTLASGESHVELPDTFGGFETPLYLVDDSAVRPFVIRPTNEGQVVHMHATQPDTTGAPRLACEKQLAGTGHDRSTRSVLYVWPVADQDYTLSAGYKHLPDALSGGFKYPPGGAEHAELFKASCLAAAELQLDDVPGPRKAEFMDRLAASVAADRKRKGSFLGYNGDNSDSREERVGRFVPGSTITYNGNPM